MRVAAVQTCSTRSSESNFAEIERIVEEASAHRVDLLVLPEHFGFYGNPEELRDSAEPLNGSTLKWAGNLAARHRICIVAGSFVELALDGRRFNTSVLLNFNGEMVCAYRKAHLFDSDVPGAFSRESDAVSAGSQLGSALIDTGDGRPLPVGMTICFDLRYPELFRALTVQGALVITVPAVFSHETGSAHWEVLLRARAIENQVFIVAANQTGTVGDGYRAYGHSMIVDPWGNVLEELATGPGFVAADLDLAEQQDVRSKLPVLTGRRPDLYV